MAWLRTSLAMISFGFTLRQFFTFLAQREHRAPVVLFGPHSYGLVMMTMGLLMLILASIQHARAMRRYHRDSGHKVFSLALVFAFVSLLIGMVALLSTLLENKPT